MKWIYLLAGLILLGVVLLSLLFYVTPLQRGDNKTSPQKNPSASLLFSDNPLFLSSNSATITTDIILKSNVPTSGTQIDISYDSQVIYGLRISPAPDNFFGSENSYRVSFSEIREQIGRATFTIEALPGAEENSGEKAVAQLSFQVNPFLKNTTSIEFLNKSTVTTRSSRKSILEQTTPLTIFFRSMNTPTTQSSEALNP